MFSEADLLQYLQTALWSSSDESTPEGGDPMDNNYNVSDFSLDALKRMRADLEAFEEAAGEMITEHDDSSMWAHDFWLTRNGHVAGFWDGDWPINGNTLTALAHAAGEVNLCIIDGAVEIF